MNESKNSFFLKISFASYENERRMKNVKLVMFRKETAPFHINLKKSLKPASRRSL